MESNDIEKTEPNKSVAPRRTAEGPNIRFLGEGNPNLNAESRRRIEYARKNEQSDFEYRKRGLERIGLPLSPEVRRYVDKFHEVAREYFVAVGIEYTPPLMYVLPQELSEEDRVALRVASFTQDDVDALSKASVHGISAEGFALVKEVSKEYSPVLEKYELVRTLIHEVGHTIRRSTKHKKGDRETYQFGLNYMQSAARARKKRDNPNVNPSAGLEEGTIEIFVEEMARRVFADEEDPFDVSGESETVRAYVKKEFDGNWVAFIDAERGLLQKELGVPKEGLSLMSVGIEEGNKTFYAESYPHSIEMTKFIKEQLTVRGYDFTRLSERAAIEGETKQFWQAIIAVFGNEAVKDIATATEGNAAEVLTRLKEKVTHQEKQ